MKSLKFNREIIQKIAMVGILTALSAVLGCIKIPIMGVSITLVLPVVVIGGALYGPLVGAWLTVLPAALSIGDAAMFLAWNPAGSLFTIFAKGILAGFVSALTYKALSKKHPVGAVTLSALVAPTVNTGIFLLGCYLFIWKDLVAMAAENSVGIGMLLVGLAGINYLIELVFNIVLCPTIFRIIQIFQKKYSK